MSGQAKKIFFLKKSQRTEFLKLEFIFGSFSCQWLNFILQPSEMENNVIFIFKILTYITALLTIFIKVYIFILYGMRNG